MTNEDSLASALKSISSLWPESRDVADIIKDCVGANDGKSRAILLEAAIKIARAALSEHEAA